jgi:hypothetical protein
MTEAAAATSAVICWTRSSSGLAPSRQVSVVSFAREMGRSSRAVRRPAASSASRGMSMWNSSRGCALKRTAPPVVWSDWPEGVLTVT